MKHIPNICIFLLALTAVVTLVAVPFNLIEPVKAMVIVGHCAILGVVIWLDQVTYEKNCRSYKGSALKHGR